MGPFTMPQFQPTYNRLAESGEGDVLLNIGDIEHTRVGHHLGIVSMEVDNPLGDPVVNHFIALVDEDEEQIETRHDRSAHVYVVAQ